MEQQQQWDIVFQKEITEAMLNPTSGVSIPSGALALLPPFVAQGQPIEVGAYDINGAVHSFKFKKRWTGQSAKPEIRKRCWKTFAAIKGLIRGDWITLYRILNEATGSYEYKVICERRWNHFGVGWLNVERFDN